MPEKQKYYSTKQVSKPFPSTRHVLKGLATATHNFFLGPTPPDSFAPRTAAKRKARRKTR